LIAGKGSDYASSVSKARSDAPAEVERTASLLHELQTPLTVLRVRLENALQASRCGPECRAAIESCLEDLRDASQMVSDLLLLEVDHGREPTGDQDAVQLAEIVSQSARGYDVLAKAKGVSFVLDALPAVRVRADPCEIRRVLRNLFDNAVQCTPSGGTIRVRITLLDGAELRVIDDGPGIPLEHQSRIFERFYQIDRPIDREQGGVGLGLAIARSLAERNGARLEVESLPGKGSTFILRFPVATND
jgi:two-component system phosphate regulon sensor histidine kinase PhoR